MKRVVVTALLFAIVIPSIAQKAKKVSGEYIYVIPETESLEQAKVSAVNRAKIQILANTFGTVMEMSSAATITNEGASVQGLSTSQVKGEWIETIGEPQLTRFLLGDVLAIKVEITGRVREITSSTAEFDAKVLCKAPDIRFESNRFESGDDLYLYFKSPQDGYLTVYLYDGQDVVFCLLPYHGQSHGAFKVKGNQGYYFFSTEVSDGETPAQLVDEYTLTASSNVEINRIYIIFSPNRFSKALDIISSEDSLPRELTFISFQKWLSKLLIEDKSAGVRQIDITINKK